MAAAVQRKAIDGELQRFTLRVTRRTVPIMFSMMFVQASERRSSAGNPSLVTVRISSNPSRMLDESVYVIDKSETKTLPFVSGLIINTMMQLKQPTTVPISIGTAKPMCCSTAK
jgi:hypothetical protein